MNALDIQSGQELERFDLGTVKVGGVDYQLLTGYEGNEERLCYWCGKKLTGKLKRYCYGCMTEYYNHFNWEYASFEAKKRADYQCENCGVKDPWQSSTKLEVHHIVPLKGGRFFSAYNLPWNLVVLCHKCHLEIHGIMREVRITADPLQGSLFKQG